MNQAFVDYFRCPTKFADFRLEDGVLNGESPGYFNFGPDLICYGVTDHNAADPACSVLPDLFEKVRYEGSTCILPFDLTEAVNNLRCERYVNREHVTRWNTLVRKIYYLLRPGFPVSIRRHLQRQWLKGWDKNIFPRWPVDSTVDQIFRRLMCLMLRTSQRARIPFIWFWPEGKASCTIMTHDVETESGLKFANELMDINDTFGIKSSFQLIPDARYVADEEARSTICRRGFEVNVHDLKHDGHLFNSHEEFLKSADRINEFVVRFGSKGYRSGALYRNLEWYERFSFSYDMSVPNVAHLDPQPGGCCTVMPYFINKILELPVTTTQDYSLFSILQTYSLDLWREQIQLITKLNGLVSFIVHPDYLNTKKARATYVALLEYLTSLQADAGMWIALPGEVDTWWRDRSAMKLVPHGDSWIIDGPGSERARVAYAVLDNDDLTYQIQ